MSSLILIPGLAGDAAMWQPQLQALAAHAPRVTDVHMKHETIPAMAAALLADHPGTLVLCGASMGGMIAMEAARQAPQRLAGLALLGTDPGPERPEMRAVREAAIALFAQGRLAEVIEPNVGFAFHPHNAQRRELVDAYLEFVLRAGADQLIRQNRAVIGRPDATRHLAAVRCPTLVVCGDSDQLTPPERSLLIAGLVPHARLEIVPECGHMLTMEQPERVNALLAGWLAGLPG